MNGAKIMSKDFFKRTYCYLKKVPSGKVVTYGQIARAIGAPRCARQVGYALHCNPQPYDIPCHRVVNRFGGLAPSFAFGGLEVQKRLLEEEGVEVSGGAVDLAKYRYMDAEEE
jgi:methylated-DNA-protein-cysteine methyltransferase-like protein